TGAGSDTTRPYDMAYLSALGNLLMAYGRNSAKKLGYRTYNGSTLSGETLLTLPSGAGTITFVRIVAKHSDDEACLLVLDNVGNLYAWLWNGTHFGSATTLVSAGSGSTGGRHHGRHSRNGLISGTAGEECFAAAYSTNSGELLVVYEDSGDNASYRTNNGLS